MANSSPSPGSSQSLRAPVPGPRVLLIAPAQMSDVQASGCGTWGGSNNLTRADQGPQVRAPLLIHQSVFASLTEPQMAQVGQDRGKRGCALQGLSGGQTGCRIIGEVKLSHSGHSGTLGFAHMG